MAAVVLALALALATTSTRADMVATKGPSEVEGSADVPQVRHVRSVEVETSGVTKCMVHAGSPRAFFAVVNTTLGTQLARDIVADVPRLSPTERDWALEDVIDQLLAYVRPDEDGCVVRVRARPGWGLRRANITLRTGDSFAATVTMLHAERFARNPLWETTVVGELSADVDEAVRDVLRAQAGATPRTVALQVRGNKKEEVILRAEVGASRGAVLEETLARCEEANVSWIPTMVEELCECAGCHTLASPPATTTPSPSSSPPPRPSSPVTWEARDGGDVTVILTQYKRPYLQAQIHALRRQTVRVARVLVWQNGAHVDIRDVCAAYDEVECVRSDANFKFHGRFALGLLATTEYVAVMDDDAIPYSRWLENAMRASREHRAIAGAVGMIFSFGDRQRWKWRDLPGDIMPSRWEVDGYGFGAHGEGPGFFYYFATMLADRRVDVVGHSWLLRTEWLPMLFRELPPTMDNGEDIGLCAAAMRFAGVACVVPAQPSTNMSGSGDVSFFLNGDKHATATTRGHDYVRFEIADFWRTRGWRTIEDSLELGDTPAPRDVTVAGAPLLGAPPHLWQPGARLDTPQRDARLDTLHTLHREP